MRRQLVKFAFMCLLGALVGCGGEEMEDGNELAAREADYYKAATCVIEPINSQGYMRLSLGGTRLASMRAVAVGGDPTTAFNGLLNECSRRKECSSCKVSNASSNQPLCIIQPARNTDWLNLMIDGNVFGSQWVGFLSDREKARNALLDSCELAKKVGVCGKCAER